MLKENIVIVKLERRERTLLKSSSKQKMFDRSGSYLLYDAAYFKTKNPFRGTKRKS